MFAEIAKKLDGLIDSDTEDDSTLPEIIAYLYQMPLLKLVGFFLYTLTFIRKRSLGSDYRSCLKWSTMPYQLRYRTAVSRMKRYLFN